MGPKKIVSLYRHVFKDDNYLDPPVTCPVIDISLSKKKIIMNRAFRHLQQLQLIGLYYNKN